MKREDLELQIAEAKTNWKKTIEPTKQGWKEEYERLEAELEKLNQEIARSN